jgi:hypothetical protein
MEKNGEQPNFSLPPPTPLNFAAAGESSAEYDVSRILGHDFREKCPLFQRGMGYH